MADDEHVRVVTKVLSECAEIRAKAIDRSGARTVDTWRGVLAHAAYRAEWSDFDRTYLNRFEVVWGDARREGLLPADARLDLSGADFSGCVFARPIMTGGFSPLEGARSIGGSTSSLPGSAVSSARKSLSSVPSW